MQSFRLNALNREYATLAYTSASVLAKLSITSVALKLMLSMQGESSINET